MTSSGNVVDAVQEVLGVGRVGDRLAERFRQGVAPLALGTNYTLRYDNATSQWQIAKSVLGVATVLGTSNQALTARQTYRVTLDMNGSTIKGYVDGVLRINVTDSAITGAGRAGVRLGSANASAVQSDTQGLHLDDFRVTPDAVDSKGANFTTTPAPPLRPSWG